MKTMTVKGKRYVFLKNEGPDLSPGDEVAVIGDQMDRGALSSSASETAPRARAHVPLEAGFYGWLELVE